MIEVQQLSKSYRVKVRRGAGLRHGLRALLAPETKLVRALDGVDFRVARGALHALVGRNGSGKSTLLKILCGILHPTSGRVEVGGVVPWRDRERYVREVGVVFGQKSQLTWELPAWSSFELHQKLYGVPRAAFERRLALLVATCEAAEIVRRPVRSLSLGERMKCELICALLHEPRVLFLDEPTIGLDLIAKEQVRRAIAEVHSALHATVVLTSHDISDVTSLCSSISLLDAGRFLYHGSVRGLLEAGAGVRRVELELDAPVSDCSAALSGYAYRQTSERRLSIELPREPGQLPAALARLVRELPVLDLSVEAIPLERVIHSLYEREAARSGALAPLERAVSEAQ